MNSAAAATPRDAPVHHVRLGKYELLSRLAVGGMAELFIARTTAQHGFEKLVALKRILASHADDDQFIQMLLAEARLAATLHHPNVAQVYDVGEVDGTYFFTMEYVFGQDLRQIVRAVQAKGEWLSPEHILQIIIGTAAGLHYAHECEASDGSPLGIVHRDVSPSNILVSYDGSVKLVDFGIARVTAMAGVTGQGMLKGKVPYMSPEQCRGEPLDRRSDVFSLAIMLWELTVRRRLYTGDNDLVIAAKICNEDAPRPTDLVADYPPELEAIVLKALARDRNERYASAQELQLDLEEYARERKMLLSSAKLAGFMGHVFADKIKAAKADLRHQIASRTGMFPVPPEDSVPAGPAASSASARISLSTPVALSDEATARSGPRAAESFNELQSTHTDTTGIRAQARRRKLVPYAAAGGALVLLALILSFTGEDPPAPTVEPTAPAAVETPSPPPATPAVAAVPPPTVTPDPATPKPTTPATPPTSSTSSTKKKLPPRKTPGKTPKTSNWDPDSPLPPP